MMQNQINKVFIVDDDPFWTNILAELLKNIGYSDIVTFDNGIDCIQNLHLNPTLIFLDYQMDEIDGIEVLQKIKNYGSETNVIFCTALEDLSVAIDAIHYGSFDYLLKSNLNKKELLAILKQIDKRKKHD